MIDTYQNISVDQKGIQDKDEGIAKRGTKKDGRNPTHELTLTTTTRIMARGKETGLTFISTSK